jgi:chorismate lyase
MKPWPGAAIIAPPLGKENISLTQHRMDRWLAAEPAATARSGSLVEWLSDPASLTARLIRHFGPVSVQVLAQGLAVPHRDEARLVGLRAGRKAWIREVVLGVPGMPLVYARSILAPEAMRGGWHMLSNIGTRPLGAVLFADPRVSRRELHVRRLNARDPRYLRAVRAAGGGQPATLWARRSCFAFCEHDLVVCEVFLAPAFGEVNNRRTSRS